MESVKIILDTGQEIEVYGIFYIFNSKYYFMYTAKEFDGGEYVKLYVVQVCKEVKSTPSGSVDTGYMLGMEISDAEEWKNIQQSITKIVEDKKNGTQSPEVQYLPMSMLAKLKVVSKNKFKLMKNIVQDNFKVDLSENVVIENLIQPVVQEAEPIATETPVESIIQEVVPITPVTPVEPVVQEVSPVETNAEESNNNKTSIFTEQDDDNDVIIDYRTRFFEEQEKNEQLTQEINQLKEKLENIKNILG